MGNKNGDIISDNGVVFEYKKEPRTAMVKKQGLVKKAVLSIGRFFKEIGKIYKDNSVFNSGIIDCGGLSMPMCAALSYKTEDEKTVAYDIDEQTGEPIGIG